MSKFLNDLSVTLVEDFGGIWKLDEDLAYRSDLLDQLIVVPKGFETDFASGPSLFWVSLARDQGRKAAVIHDWLYSTQAVPRELADGVLHEALIAEGYSNFTAGVYWSAVRAFGGSHWKAPNLPQNPVVEDAMAKAGG